MNKILTLKHDPILGSSFILIDKNETIHPNVELIIPELIEGIPDTHGDIITKETLQEVLKNTNQ